jgi:hypothetical protein
MMSIRLWMSAMMVFAPVVMIGDAADNHGILRRRHVPVGSDIRYPVDRPKKPGDGLGRQKRWVATTHQNLLSRSGQGAAIPVRGAADWARLKAHRVPTHCHGYRCDQGHNRPAHEAVWSNAFWAINGRRDFSKSVRAMILAAVKEGS